MEAAFWPKTRIFAGRGTRLKSRRGFSKAFKAVAVCFGAEGNYAGRQAGFGMAGEEKGDFESGNFANGILFRVFGGCP
jgi:hypothetical protein